MIQRDTGDGTYASYDDDTPPVEQKEYLIDIVMEFPERHTTRESAEKRASRIKRSLEQEYPYAHIESSIWARTPDP